MPDSSLGLRPFVIRVLVVLGLIALALFLWKAFDALLLIFGASLVAILLRALAEPIARFTRLPETAALSLVVGTLLALAVLGGWLFGDNLVAQLRVLVEQLPDAWQDIQASMRRYELGAMVLDGLKASQASNVGVFAEKLTQATTIASTAVLQLLVVLFGGLYLAGNPERYRRGFLKLVPEAAREHIAGVIDTSARALRLWLVGQLFTMLAVGALTALGLWLIGLPAPLALGLLAGLLEFVPYVGPILAAVPGLLIATSVGPDTVLYALLVYVVVQQVESNAIVPLVARQVLSLPPALAIFSVVALGLVFGPLGLVFAAPLTVLLVVAIGKLYVRETLGQPVKVPGEEARGKVADN